MSNFNKVILVGNITRDPALTYLPSQTAVVDFGLAINRKWKDQGGVEKQEVCFIDCQAFGKPAETINKYCKKGAALLVDGRLKFEQWDGKDGSKHSKHRVIVEAFQFIGSKTENGGEQSEPQQPQNNQPAPPQNGYGQQNGYQPTPDNF